MKTVPSTTATLQDVASVDNSLNVAATKTVPLFEHLAFAFLFGTTCSPHRNEGEHEFISHRISSAVFCTYYEEVYRDISVEARVFGHESF